MLTQSATELAARIRRRDLRAIDVVEAHIRQIQRVNPQLNAVVCDRFDAARDEARRADSLVHAGGDLPPLLGVPCTIKEAFALTGMPNTSGLVARRGTFAEIDAPGVERLRAAGAIPLGVTNVSELCMWMESNNKLYGRTNNAYDLRRTAGGSSGGEGAIVGSGASPFGLGSDIGGSIRMPAFFNGVFGHKPTGGLVENAGQYPLPTGGAIRYVTTGPLCRRGEDLWPLLRILAGSQHIEGDPAHVRLDRLRVISVEDNGSLRVSRELCDAQRAAEEALAKRGAEVRRERVPGLERTFEIWSAMLDAEQGPSFASLLGCGTDIRAGWELLSWMVGRSDHTLPAIGLALLEKIPKLIPSHGRKLVEAGLALRAELTRIIGDGVMLYPPYPSVAPRHVMPLFPPFSWVYTAIFNVMELPVTAVPLGLSARGLPLGVQVAATHGQDHRTIAVALELEKAFGGWVPPPSRG